MSSSTSSPAMPSTAVELRFRSSICESRIWLGHGGGDQLSRELGQLPGPRLLVTEARVARACQRQMEALMDVVDLHRLILPAGEEAKHSASLLTILAEMAGLGMERGSPLCAFGGGMIGDLGGLAASLWKRGAPLVLAPTSLLAMVDACVGGKTAINFGGIRNAVGSFWPAQRVVIDLDCLKSLPDAEWTCGFGELLKTAWLSEDAWALALERDPAALLRADHPDLQAHVERALRVKIGVVEGDEREADGRALLNLGHSFAHALEAMEEVELKHGQAVLYGMLAAARASRLAHVAATDAADEMEERLRQVLRALGLLPAPALAELPLDRLMMNMRQDKKVRQGRLRLVLPECAGSACLRDVEAALVERAWIQWGEMLR